MNGRSQHYIPAGFLGRFSADSGGPMRERRLWALEVGQEHAELTTAEQVGCADNLYRLYGEFNNQDPDTIDEVWSRYEQKLGPALDELSRQGQRTIGANTWLRVLVPFVTGLFVRGEEFGQRYDTRMSEFYANDPYGNPRIRSDNTNNSRLFEFQRLLAPVMAARWVVMHAEGDTPVITNELGFTIFQPPGGGDPGIAIPVGPKTILGIIRTWPEHGRPMMRDGGTGQWRAVIEHVPLTPNNQRGFNEAMANISRGFLAGPSAESVEPYKTLLDDSSRLRAEMVEAFWPRRRILVAHEFEWHRAATAISNRSTALTQADLQHIDFEELNNDWSPFIMIPHNLREFPSGLQLHGNEIGIAMTEIPGFTDGTQDSPYIIRPPIKRTFIKRQAAKFKKMHLSVRKRLSGLSRKRKK